MLKKLLSIFGLGEKEEEQTEQRSYESRKPASREEEEDEDEDDEDEDKRGHGRDNGNGNDDNNDNNEDNDDDDDEEPELSDLDFTEEEEERLEEGDGPSGTYDPATYHSLKYTEQQFVDEVEKRIKEFVKNREVKGKVFTDSDILDLRTDIGQRLFRKWNNGLRIEKFCMKWQEKVYNVTSFATGSAKHDENNPLLAPVHGVTLQDYAAMGNKLAAGISINDLLAALGIEKPIWDEASTIWGQRLQEDATYTVPNLFAHYMTESDSHPKLGPIVGAPKTAEGIANAARVLNDERFYIEIFAARTAAYDHGYDGTQWMLENYGLDMTDMQKAIVKWGEERNKNLNNPHHEKMDKYMVAMEEKYAAEFTQAQGGGIADDIEF